jgi:subtilisin-like proprotein convertase family protein
MSLRNWLGTASICVAALGITAPLAGASTFSNPNPISIVAGPAQPYPSQITVDGIRGAAVDVNVTLRGLSHTYPLDVDVLLVAPSGQATQLMSDVCGTGTVPLSGVNFEFDQSAPLTLPSFPTAPCPSGRYKPTAVEPLSDSFPAPAPPVPAAVSLDSLNPSLVSGTWSLYVTDDTNNDNGTLAGGWTLDVLPDVSCSGVRATDASVVGTAGDDVLTGTPNADVMLGLGGKDQISGLGGRDVVCGGPGNDTLKGGSGIDELLGEGGKDKLKGNAGKDTCKGGGGRDDAKGCEKERSL